MKLILCDQAPEALTSWRAQFVKRPEVEIRDEDILKTQADAVLIPGNSFGFLDSGLGLRVSDAFGWEIQDALRDRIQNEHDGELFVGQALVVRHASAPGALVYAPLWRTPRPLNDTVNVYLSVRGALLAVTKDTGASPIASLAVPAMELESSGLNPLTSARQTRYAYDAVCLGKGRKSKNLSQQTRRERKMASVPRVAEEPDGETGEG